MERPRYGFPAKAEDQLPLTPAKAAEVRTFGCVDFDVSFWATRL